MKSIIVLVSIICLLSLSSQAQQKEIVTYSMECPDTIKAGDTLRMIITVNVKAGYYLYAPVDINALQGMQVTQVLFPSLPARLRRGGIQLPPHHQKGPFAVYEGGNNVFTQTFIVNKQIHSDSLIIAGRLIYQACDSNICYPPVSEKFEKTVRAI